jgi:uncharacterized protein
MREPRRYPGGVFPRRKQTLVSRAEVATATPERYAKQLLSHLGHRVPVENTPDGDVLTFEDGRGVVRVGDGVLLLQAEAKGEKALAVVQDVLGRHLERFGTKAELTVSWSPAAPD